MPNAGYIPVSIDNFIGHPDKYVVFILYKFDEINCDMKFLFDTNVDVKENYDIWVIKLKELEYPIFRCIIVIIIFKA
jgi:hypothetical protein